MTIKQFRTVLFNWFCIGGAVAAFLYAAYQMLVHGDCGGLPGC